MVATFGTRNSGRLVIRNWGCQIILEIAVIEELESMDETPKFIARYVESRKSGFEITAFVNRQPDGSLWKDCFDRLVEMHRYEIDWDDDGGLPPSSQCIAHAMRIAKSLRHAKTPAPTRCHATDEGNIILSWKDSDEYFELEFDGQLQCVGRRLEKVASRSESATIQEFSHPY